MTQKSGFKTNQCLLDVKKELDPITLVEFGYLTGVKPRELSRWFRDESQIKFNRLEELVAGVGLKVEIVISKRN